MCGIAGIIYRHSRDYSRLGSDLLTLIQPLESRGPDSSGVALYHSHQPSSVFTIVLRGQGKSRWQDVLQWFEAIAPVAQTAAITNGQRIRLDLSGLEGLDLTTVRWGFRQQFPDLHWVSAGYSLEVYKEVGAVANLDNAYGLHDFSGSHGIGHTRMATESAVDTDHCHPFTAGTDLAIVHNGQISNYYRLRFQLERSGVIFETDNDSELLAHYINYHLQQGEALESVLYRLLDVVDGTYTFLVATVDYVGLVRDRTAAKPAVIYETENMVAIASEYRALLNLPDFNPKATVREPDASEINIWSTATGLKLAPPLSKALL